MGSPLSLSRVQHRDSSVQDTVLKPEILSPPLVSSRCSTVIQNVREKKISGQLEPHGAKLSIPPGRMEENIRESLGIPLM